MAEPKSGSTKRSRGAYSRLICLGCRERRIRCELPRDVEIPDPGELRPVQTPCYRCKRLGTPCIVRQTILGRPNAEGGLNATADPQLGKTRNVVSHVVIELPLRTAGLNQPVSAQDEARGVDRSVIQPARLRTSNHLRLSQTDRMRWKEHTLLIHKPQSTETVVIIHALDTLQREKVEDEWFRHLPALVGHNEGLDLSIKALVAACEYARGVPKLTANDCYQALALALTAVQASFKQSGRRLNDEMLASTALLAHFEGVTKKHGIPAYLHLEGLAGILMARPASTHVTDLARQIFDFHVCDTAVMACIQGVPSPFESVSRAYFVNNRVGCSNNDQSQLKALGSELFICIPRLVGLVRSLRFQPSSRTQVLCDLLDLSKALLDLKDPGAEERLLQHIKIKPASRPSSLLRQNLQLSSVQEFEALAYYWLNRLTLLRLEQFLYDFIVSCDIHTDETRRSEDLLRAGSQTRIDEMFQLVKNILMCGEYAEALPLRKHQRLTSHAIVVIWGVLRDFPTVFDIIQDGVDPKALYELLLRNVSIALVAKPPLTVEDMDVASNVFVGGKAVGRFVELYGL